MRSPSADTKSTFEKFFASSEGQYELYERLETARVARQEATPEPSSSDHSSIMEDYKWQCNILHIQFEGRELDCMRLAVAHPDYWKVECQQYANELQQLLLRIPNEKEKEGEPTAQQWRTAALRYRDIVQSYGMSFDEANRIRHSIDNQKYWAEELEVVQQSVALREHQTHEATRKKKMDIQRRRQERVKRCLQSIGELSPPRPMHLSPTQAPRQGGSVVTRTRSKTRVGRTLRRRGAQGDEAGANKAARTEDKKPSR
ncbi:hypothetical protein IF2G_10308 [Cordyceps javanica]|nr:hypothetical protein IF2G_10308 [Cordyceps javanica]